MQVLDHQQTASVLPYLELSESIRTVLEMKKARAITAPERMVVALDSSGTLLVMPATDGIIGVVKTVTVHPDNGTFSLPTVQSDVLVLDATRGRRLGLLDGNTVTARRTAALSLLASFLLAPNPKGPLLIIGAGVQARAHLEAFVEGHGLKQVYLHSRTRSRVEKLLDYAGSLGCDARLVDHLETVLDKVPLIVTATNSRSPVLPEKVRNDAFIAAIGAYTPEMAELPAGIIAKSKVFVDTLEGARREAGDLIQADIDWDRVTALENCLSQRGIEGGPVVFKSVGHALFDLAAARLAFPTTSGNPAGGAG